MNKTATTHHQRQQQKTPSPVIGVTFSAATRNWARLNEQFNFQLKKDADDSIDEFEKKPERKPAKTSTRSSNSSRRSCVSTIKLRGENSSLLTSDKNRRHDVALQTTFSHFPNAWYEGLQQLNLQQKLLLIGGGGIGRCEAAAAVSRTVTLPAAFCSSTAKLPQLEHTLGWMNSHITQINETLQRQLPLVTHAQMIELYTSILLYRAPSTAKQCYVQRQPDTFENSQHSNENNKNSSARRAPLPFPWYYSPYARQRQRFGAWYLPKHPYWRPVPVSTNMATLDDRIPVKTKLLCKRRVERARRLARMHGIKLFRNYLQRKRLRAHFLIETKESTFWRQYAAIRAASKFTLAPFFKLTKTYR